MSERGGPAAQSGFRYQNVIAAEWYAKMLNDDQIKSIRVESTEHVDDIVIEYKDKRKMFQQIKEYAPGGGNWTINKIKDILLKFKEQYENNKYDSIEFISKSSADVPRTICEVAENSLNLNDFNQRLNKSQKSEFNRITKIIDYDEQTTFLFLKQINFKTPYQSGEDIESQVTLTYLDYLDNSKIIFNILINLASQSASKRKENNVNDVIKYLKSKGIENASIRKPDLNKQSVTSLEVTPELEIEPIDEKLSKLIRSAKESKGIRKYDKIEDEIYKGDVPLGNGRTLHYDIGLTTKFDIEITGSLGKHKLEPELKELKKDVEIPKDLTGNEIFTIKLISYFDGINNELLQCLLNMSNLEINVNSLLTNREIVFSEKKDFAVPDGNLIDIIFVYERIKNNFPLSYEEENTIFPELIIKAVDSCKEILIHIYLTIEKNYLKLNEEYKEKIICKINENTNDPLFLWAGSILSLKEKELLSLRSEVVKLDNKNIFTPHIYFNFAQGLLKSISKDGVITSKTKIDADVVDNAKKLIERSLEIDESNPKYLSLFAFSNLLLGNHKLSIINSIKALNKDPKNITALNTLGVTYFHKKQYEEALTYFNQIRNKEPNHIQNLANIGGMYKALNNYEEAKKYFSKVIKMEPNDDRINAELGVAYYHLRDYEKADKYLKKSLKINSECELGHFGKGDLYKNIYRNPSKAIYHYNIGLELDPTNLVGWIALAEAYNNNKEYDESKKIYDKLIIENPNEKSVQIGFAGLYANMGDIDNTKIWCDKLIETDPQDEKPFYSLGVAYANSKETNKALEYFDKALELNPLNNEIINTKAKLLFSQNKLDDSKKILLESIEINPKNSGAFLLLAKIENNNQNFDIALEYIKEAKELGLSGDDFEYIYGVININLKDYDGALISFKKALKFNPNTFDVLKALGNLYGLRNDFNKAKSTLLKASRIKPSDTEVTKYLATAYFNLMKYKKSIELYESIYESRIDDFGINYLLGLSYAYIFDFNSAIKKYERAFKINSEDEQLLLNLGICLFHLNQYENAIEKFQKNINKNPKNIEAWLFLIDSQVHLDLEKETKNSIKRLLDIKPNDNMIYFRLGMIYNSIFNHMKAIKYLELSIEAKETKEALMELGFCYTQVKKYKESIKTYKRILNKFEEDSRVLTNLGASYSLINQDNKAIKYLKRSIQIDNKDFVSLINLSAISIKKGNIQEANDYLMKGLEINPKDFDILARLGDINCNYLFKFNDALNYYKRANKLEPKNKKVVLAIANCYNNLFNFSDAIKWFKKVLTIDENNINALSMISICYSFLRNHKMSKKWFKKAEKIDPNDYNVFLAKAVFNNNMMNLDDAVLYSKKGLEINPTSKMNYILYTILGNSFNLKKDYSKSIYYFETAKEMNPTDINILKLGGYPYLNSGKIEKAIEYWEKYLTLVPNDWEYLGYLGTAYMKFGNYEKAIEIFSKLTISNPTDIRTFYSLGEVYRKSNDIEKAIEIYNDIKEFDKSEKPYLHIGDIYYNVLKDFENAIPEYERALEINSNNLLAWQNLGISYNEEDDFEKGVQCFNKGLEIDPNNIQLLTIKGHTLIDIEEIEEALKIFDHIIEIDPNDVNGWYYKSIIYSIKDDKEKVIEFLKKVLEIDKSMIKYVIRDTHFYNIKSTKEFKELIEKYNIDQ